MNFTFEIDSQPAPMDIDGETKEKVKTVDALEQSGVKLQYHALLVDFAEPKTIHLIGHDVSTQEQRQTLEQKSKYIMNGTFMQHNKGYLYVSFGGLIGQFKIQSDNVYFSNEWSLYVV